MAQVLIRDLDEKVLRALKQRAEANHRSLQGELHAIITRAIGVAKILEAFPKRLETEAPRAQYSNSAQLIREHRDGVRNDLIPGNSARKRAAAPRGSVWKWLSGRSAGKLTKAQIDRYIREERDSWGDA